MKLNDLHPAVGAATDRKRVGRGIGSGLGKTAGRGHKGQKSRAGGFHKRGFEGGQMPLQRRLPKFGFTSRVGRYAEEVRLGELAAIESGVIDLAALKAANIVKQSARQAKVMLSGGIDRPVTLRGIGITKGARAAIEAAGGKVEE